MMRCPFIIVTAGVTAGLPSDSSEKLRRAFGENVFDNPCVFNRPTEVTTMAHNKSRREFLKTGAALAAGAVIRAVHEHGALTRLAGRVEPA